MISSIRNSISLSIRVLVFSSVLVGPLCAMAIGHERDFGEEASGAGIVILTSLKRS